MLIISAVILLQHLNIPDEFITFSQHSSTIKLQIETSFQKKFEADNMRYNSLLHGTATSHSQTFTE